MKKIFSFLLASLGLIGLSGCAVYDAGPVPVRSSVYIYDTTPGYNIYSRPGYVYPSYPRYNHYYRPIPARPIYVPPPRPGGVYVKPIPSRPPVRPGPGFGHGGNYNHRR